MTINYELQPGKERIIRQKYNNYKPVISIITPCWNSEEYLVQLANCILNQTYPYFEWLLIDDGSTKKESLDLYEKIVKMDDRIKLYHKENEGLSLTRDYGVSKTSKDTEFLVFIDDDDLLDPTFLECAYYTMSVNKDASWCYSDVLNFQAREFPWCKKFSSETMKYENLLVSQAMVRKEAYYEAGGFKIQGNGYYEDWIFWLKLLSKGRYPIHMSYFGFWYRKKEGNGQLKNAVNNHKRNMEMIKEYAKRIKEEVKPIEFPRGKYDWCIMPTEFEDIVIPDYQKDKKKNILMIVPWMIMGGADKFNLDFISLIDRNKYRITLVSTIPTEYNFRQQFEHVADEVFDLPSFLDRKDWLSFITYLIKSRKFDLIFNTNSQYGYSILPYLKAKFPSIPIMDYIHMEEWYNRAGGYSRDSASVGSVISKTLFCNENSEKILVDYFEREPKTVDTVYIGVDTNKFDPKKFNKKALLKKYNIPKNKIIVSLIARIDYQKRPFLLMEIVKRCKKVDNDLFFVIAGDGQLLNNVKSIAKKYNLNNIMFLGQVDTPSEIYAISDITLNCSIKEGLALTSYESLSMGVPVVSANVGGQKELINDEVGVIVECLQKEEDIFDFDYTDKEIDSYVDGLQRIKKDLKNYKDNCRKRILEGFTLDKMAINMQKQIDSIIRNYKEDRSLVEHEDLTIELVNQFLLSNEYEYEWYVSKYDKIVYNYEDVAESLSAKNAFLHKLKNFSMKIHLYHETLLTYQYVKQIINQIKCLFIHVFTLPYLIIKYLVLLIIMLAKRIFHLFRKIFNR